MYQFLVFLVFYYKYDLRTSFIKVNWYKIKINKYQL